MAPSLKKTEWQKCDEDADKVLEATAKGDVEKRLQTMTTIIVSMVAERFGVEKERGAKQPYSKNQRAVKIHNIRKELKALKKQHKEARGEECAPLEELCLMLRKRLLTLCRAEQHRRRRRERMRKRTAFISNLFGFTRELLEQKRSGHLACSKEEADQHLQNTFSDPTQDQDLGQCEVVIRPPEPSEAFDLREPGCGEESKVQVLYGNTCKLRLPLKSIEEEFKVLRAREVLQFRESTDPKVSGAGVAVKTGRKWRAEAAVEQAESRLRHGVLVGAVTRGRAGLGTIATPCYDKARGKEQRQLVQKGESSR